jgi:uncharacterized protein YfcZ (UPF0381/DUF406 family)
VKFYVEVYGELCCVVGMERLFDPDAIRAQIANLGADRARIDHAIESLEDALRSIERMDSTQVQLPFDPSVAEMTLHDAVKRCCNAMADGITRQGVVKMIEMNYPNLRPKSASVAASLVNLTKGDQPVLKVAIEGKGRSPSFYSTTGNTVLKLAKDEIEGLLDETATHGTGGWQSLWLALLKQFDKSKGTITLTPELRARIYRYYREYGSGGWQNKVKRVFRRELPHLFS